MSSALRLSAFLLSAIGCAQSAPKPAEHPAPSESKSTAARERSSPAEDLGPNVCAGEAPAVAALPVRYEPRGGRFVVQLPRLPSADSADDAEDDDRVSVAEPQAMYEAGHKEGPPGILMMNAREMLDRLRDGAVEGGKGTLDSEHDVSCHGSPGREFVVLGPNGVAAYRMRSFIIGTHFYRVGFATFRGAEQSALATAYLDSFRPILP